MASLQVTPPEPLSFSNPEKWPKWIGRFERFRSVSGLDKKTTEKQVDTLIYSMGDKVENILDSFKLKEDQRKSYTVVISKL